MGRRHGMRQIPAVANVKTATAYEGLRSQLMDRYRCDLVAQLGWLDGSQFSRLDSRESRMPCRWVLFGRTARRSTRPDR
jgi:hypothetical protein